MLFMPAPLNKISSLTTELDNISKTIADLQRKQNEHQQIIHEIKLNIIHIQNMINLNIKMHKKISPTMITRLQQSKATLIKENVNQLILKTNLINAQSKQMRLMIQIKNEQLLLHKEHNNPIPKAPQPKQNDLLFHKEPLAPRVARQQPIVPPKVAKVAPKQPAVPPKVAKVQPIAPQKNIYAVPKTFVEPPATKITSKTIKKPINQQPEQFLTPEEIKIAKAYFAQYPQSTKLSKKMILSLNDNKQVKLACSVIKSTDGKLYALYGGKQLYKPKNVKGLLGKGTYGKVKLAQSLDDGTIIAAKVQTVRLTEKEKISDIKKEENIQKAVGQYLGSTKRHDPNYKLTTKYYTFSEFVEGQSLTNYFRNNYNLPITKKLEIILAILKATKELHNKDIIHADLSFNNVLYDPKTGKVTIIDFGFANKADLNHSITLPFPIPFNPKGYNAPECKSGKATYRSDIYSLGKWIEWDVAAGNPFLTNLAANMLIMDPFKRPNSELCIKAIEQYLDQIKPHPKMK